MTTARRERFIDSLGQIGIHTSRCVRCGFCNAVCPTSNVSSAYKESRTSRGRIILLQSIEDGIGAADPYSTDFKNLIDLCYSCRRCISVCPAGIPIPDVLARARYAYLKQKPSRTLTLGHRVFANYGLFDKLGSSVAPLSNWVLRKGSVRKLMEWATHIDSRANLPRFEATSFESWFRKQPLGASERKIVYFVDSYANYNNTEYAKKIFVLVNHLGYEMLLPPQKESGMPTIEYGMLDKARQLAMYNISHLAPYTRDGMRILCSSPATTYLLREGYKTILDNSPDLEAVSKATVDVAELIREAYEDGAIQFNDEEPMNVKYHECCLSKALSLGPTTTKLLEVAGVEFETVEDCCGGAGVWGTFKENYDMSSEIAAKLQPKLESSTILTESETCRLQIEGHTNLPVFFPIDVLLPRIVGMRSNPTIAIPSSTTSPYVGT